MKILTAITATIAVSICFAEDVPAQTAPSQIVYIVSRSANAESHALLSARLVKLKAANLHWYEGTNVLRAELPAESLDEVRSDPDVILAIPEQCPPDPSVSPIRAGPADAGTPVAPPSVGGGMTSPSPMPMAPPQGGIVPSPQPGFGPGTGMGMAMGIGPGLMDSLAGMVVTRLFNPPPSCRISIARVFAEFAAAGGDDVIGVRGTGSCAWQARSSVPWIKITSGSGASGTGIVSYTVAAIDGKKRSGSISIVAAQGGSPIKGTATVVVKQLEN